MSCKSLTCNPIARYKLMKEFLYLDMLGESIINLMQHCLKLTTSSNVNKIIMINYVANITISGPDKVPAQKCLHPAQGRAHIPILHVTDCCDIILHVVGLDLWAWGEQGYQTLILNFDLFSSSLRHPLSSSSPNCAGVIRQYARAIVNLPRYFTISTISAPSHSHLS